MSSSSSESPESHDAISPRAVLVIVLAGIALGLGFNALQRDADPARALPWVKGERTVAKLELESHTPPPAVVAAPGPASAAEPRPPAPARVPAAAARIPGTSSFVSRAPRLDPSAASGAPVGADTHPPLSPPLRVPAAAGAAGEPAAAAAGVPAIADSREPMDASLDVVRRLHEAGAAVILDARSPDEYAVGHIAGALSLPFDDVFKHPERVRAVEAKGRPVVTYCDGGDCDLSRNLAFSLIDAGQRKVLVFTGGLPAWRGAGLAVHTGAQP